VETGLAGRMSRGQIDGKDRPPPEAQEVALQEDTEEKEGTKEDLEATEDGEVMMAREEEGA